MTLSVTVSVVGCTTSSSRNVVIASCSCGDTNGDGFVSAADVFHLVRSLFAAGAAPVGCADANGDGVVSVADVFHLINYLFAGGPIPH